MEYLIVLNVIALSVTLGFLMTPTKKDNSSDRDANRSNAKKTAAAKKCSRCSAEMDAKDIICKSCGSLINIFRKER